MNALPDSTPKTGPLRLLRGSRRKSATNVDGNVPDLTLQLASLYERVAEDLRIEVVFVRRVALGEMYSPAVERALRRELTRIVKKQAAKPARPGG